MSPSEVPARDTRSPVTARVIAHPWLRDINNHLNTRHYQGFFEDACQHLLAICGFAGAAANDKALGVADVACALEYREEVAPGALLVIVSGFRKLGGKSFTTFHEMRSVDGSRLHATCETTSLFLDLTRRRSAAVPDDFRAKAERLLFAAE